MSPDLSLPVPAAAAARLHHRLLAWYDVHRRDMPWRRTRDPYAVWLSEVMLQQTRVETALPYYRAFLARFPTLASLASARPAEVLELWSGLGYYRRARHLHEASRLVIRDYAGRVPDDPETFRGLPGVGRYTAGAVLSICFDRPLPVLDGNVARVLSRLFAIPAAIRDPRGAKRLWALAEALVPMLRTGDWNQAVMELGATLCVPRAPQCGRCPLRSLCRARRLGRVEEFPPVAPRRRSEPVRRAVALIARRGRVLMERRSGSLLAGLWEPPGVELANGTPAARALQAALGRLGVRTRLERTPHTVRHVITHRSITAEIWNGAMIGAAPRRADLRWVDPSHPAVPLTALARKLTLRRNQPPFR